MAYLRWRRELKRLKKIIKTVANTLGTLSGDQILGNYLHEKTLSKKLGEALKVPLIQRFSRRTQTSSNTIANPFYAPVFT